MGTRTAVVKSPNVQSLRIKVPKRDQFRGEGAAMESTTLLSKLRNAVRSRSRIDAGFCFGHVPLPLGEGGEAPGEGRKCTLIRPFGPPSPRGRRTVPAGFRYLDSYDTYCPSTETSPSS